MGMAPGEASRGRPAGAAPVSQQRGGYSPLRYPRQLGENSLSSHTAARWWSHPYLGACPSLTASWLRDLGWPWAASSLTAWSRCEGWREFTCTAPNIVAGARVEVSPGGRI